MMTREEAIKFAEHAVSMTDIPDVKEFYRMSAAALRPVSREQVEKVWRGEWIWVGEDRWSDTYECSKCGKLSMNDYLFCPNCNSAMNDEAVEMVMERLNKLEETKK